MNCTRAVFPSYVTQPAESGAPHPDQSAGNCTVTPGLSPSLAEGGPSLFRVMAVGLLLLPGAGAAAAHWEAPEFEDPALQVLSDYVKVLVATHAADQGYVGERHFLDGNLDVVTAAWSGALEAGVGEVSLWREVARANAGKEDKIAADLRSATTRANAAPGLANVIARGQGNRQPQTERAAGEVQRFQKPMTHPNATFEVLCFYNAQSPSLSRFMAGSAPFNLASVGFHHVESAVVMKDHTMDRVTNVASRLQPEYLEATVGAERQKDMHDGLKRSRDAGHRPIYVATAPVYRRDGEKPAPGQQQRFIDRHLAMGGGVMVLGSITVVVPPEAVAVSQEFAEQNPGVAVFHCGTLPGCKPPAAVKAHDET